MTDCLHHLLPCLMSIDAVDAKATGDGPLPGRDRRGHMRRTWSTPDLKRTDNSFGANVDSSTPTISKPTRPVRGMKRQKSVPDFVVRNWDRENSGKKKSTEAGEVRMDENKPIKPSLNRQNSSPAIGDDEKSTRIKMYDSPVRSPQEDTVCKDSLHKGSKQRQSPLKRAMHLGGLTKQLSTPHLFSKTSKSRVSANTVGADNKTDTEPPSKHLNEDDHIAMRQRNALCEKPSLAESPKKAPRFGGLKKQLSTPLLISKSVLSGAALAIVATANKPVDDETEQDTTSVMLGQSLSHLSTTETDDFSEEEAPTRLMPLLRRPMSAGGRMMRFGGLTRQASTPVLKNEESDVVEADDVLSTASTVKQSGGNVAASHLLPSPPSRAGRMVSAGARTMRFGGLKKQLSTPSLLSSSNGSMRKLDESDEESLIASPKAEPISLLTALHSQNRLVSPIRSPQSKLNALQYIENHKNTDKNRKWSDFIEEYEEIIDLDDVDD